VYVQRIDRRFFDARIYAQQYSYRILRHLQAGDEREKRMRREDNELQDNIAP